MLAWLKKHLKTPASFDGPMVETSHFELRLSKAWVQEETHDPERFGFTSRDGSHITISSMAWALPADRLPDAATILMESRGRSLGEGLGGYKYEVSDLKVIPVPYPGIEVYARGGAREIGYFSCTFALLTEGFVINLYVESPASSEKHNEAKFQVVMEGLGIKVPAAEAGDASDASNAQGG